MKEGFYSSNIWDAINNISNSKLLKKVASAYISDGIDFNWQPGDILLVGLSEENVKKGFVNPTALEQLIDKGVKIYKVEKLHAKIYINSEATVVCSCNLSKASKDKWIEAGIFSTNEEIMTSIEHFFKLYIDDRNLVDKFQLQSLQKLFGISDVEHTPEIKIKDSVYRLWSVYTSPGKLEDHATQEKINKSHKQVELKVDQYKYSYFNFKTNSEALFEMKEGDFVLRFETIDSELNIHYPYKCKEVTKIREDLFLIHLVKKKGIAPIPWKSLKEEFISYGFSENTLEIKEMKQNILDKLTFKFLDSEYRI